MRECFALLCDAKDPSPISGHGRSLATWQIKSGEGRLDQGLFDRGHRLAGQSGKGLNFTLQGERLGAEASVLQRVP
jgi:hypothetical protein